VILFHAPGIRVLPRLLVLAALACLLGVAPVQAENQGSIKLPEYIPDLDVAELTPYILDPEPMFGAWANPANGPLGVHLDNYQVTPEMVEAARSTGCRLIRLAIPMEKFLEDADPDWAVLDQVISRINRAGFEILPVLTAKVAVPEFYVQFCDDVASRYGSTFTYYQLLDNINYKIGLTSRDYADLISLARTSIVLADRDAVIVSGGIRGADLTYLEMLQSQGAMSCIDIIALNLFPPRDGIEGTVNSMMSEHSLPYAGNIVEWAAQRGKRVWVTSMSVSSCYTWGGGDQIEQAQMYSRGALFLGFLGIERIIIGSIQDTDPSFQVPAGNCGLLDITGTPKASYYALRTLNSTIAGAYRVAAPCLHQGATYDQPDSSDMLMAPELIGVEGADVVRENRIHDLSIFSYWFYQPESEQYLMIYWLEKERRNNTLLKLIVGHIGLTPLEQFILLDNAPSPVRYTGAPTFQYIEYIPLSAMPGVIRFEVNEHGRSS